MAGFGKTKEAAKEEEEEAIKAETPAHKSTSSEPFALLQKELQLMDNSP